jgi:hypothetical protein
MRSAPEADDATAARQNHLQHHTLLSIAISKQQGLVQALMTLLQMRCSKSALAAVCLIHSHSCSSCCCAHLSELMMSFKLSSCASKANRTALAAYRPSSARKQAGMGSSGIAVQVCVGGVAEQQVDTRQRHAHASKPTSSSGRSCGLIKR